jgi:ABC-type polysaccharide/polyol phosphate export permease
MNKLTYSRVCAALIRTDLVVFKDLFFDKFIDLSIWMVLMLFVNGYIMQFFGLASNFGAFQLAGVIASSGLFELYGNVIELVSDFEGERIINYNATLPIPSWLAVLCKSAYYFIIYMIFAITMLPICIACIWKQIDITQIAYGKLLLALIAQSAFYAGFVIWTASLVANMAKLGNIWSRFIFPMWILGGFQFSWLALYSVMPSLAYASLINPLIYITEAIRATTLGQADYLNFWLCIATTFCFAGISLYLGIKNVKKRLDLV